MSKDITEEVLALIEQAIKEIGFGSVTLVLQDARIIQMEKLEKIRFGEKPAKCVNKPADAGSCKTRVLQAVSGMEYGKVAIQIQSGQIMQVERTEKYRVGKLTGLNGDGI
ncbi:MAG: hypothetical protein H6Q72_1995 [Firmicutes bacterium]|nr:hypothetical protein [Bacillota bacterium]